MTHTILAGSVPARLVANLEQEDEWHVHGLSNLQQMAVVINVIVTVMTARGYPSKDVFGARLVLEEAISNAIKHGHQYDPTKVVEVAYCIRSDHFLVEVEDEGAGFDPLEIPDATAPENLERPCGRGLLLMRHYAAWVRHNRKGNCVTFCICPSQPLAASPELNPLTAAEK